MKPKKQFKDQAYEKIGGKLWDHYGLHVKGSANPTLNARLVQPLMARLKKPLKWFILYAGLRHNET